MILSILIPTLEKRKPLLNRLLKILNQQIERLKAGDKVEILIESDTGQKTTGEKRNILIERAKGKYVVGIDDDDIVPNYYIEEILKAAVLDRDCMAINGTMITSQTFSWDIRIANGYYQKGRKFYRYPNHITPIKRELAKQVKFPHITIGEDYAWATALRQKGLLKTEAIIQKPMYIYKPS